MAKPARASTPRETELSVLDQSRRRCALCFHLKGDLAEKHGQIAHLDDDRANSAEDNLAFLCMEHHSLFDSKTSQHKNYTIPEAKAARASLYQAIQEDRHINGNPPPARGREADRENLQKLMALMTETASVEFVRVQDFAGSFEWDRVRALKDGSTSKVQNMSSLILSWKHCVPTSGTYVVSLSASLRPTPLS